MRIIGRPRQTLHDSIDTQMEKKLIASGMLSIREEVSNLAKSQIVITQLADNPDLSPEANPVTTGDSEIGVDYSTDPPTQDTEFTTGAERSDNLDDFMLLLIPRVTSVESQITSLKPWYTVQYIPIGIITQINIPHPIVDAKVWKNGIRLFEGASYDFTISGSSVLVAGIANDRFIVEYTTSWVGS
jgi:hypothetical protein